MNASRRRSSRVGLQLAFAGTPVLAATVLKCLLETGRHPVKQVYTQPDRPAGRGRKPRASAIKELALEWNLPLIQPDRAESMDPDRQLENLDLLVVVAFGMILPADIISRPRLGSINIHTSLLPRWRGAAPIQRAIEAGDTETGVSIMQMDAGLDTGPILAQASCPITPRDNSGTLNDRLARLGADCLQNTLDKLEHGTIQAVAQDDQKATYAPKITKAEARLDWNRSAWELDRQIRAFNPHPVAYCELNGQTFRIWEAEPVAEKSSEAPGAIIAGDKSGINITTADGVLRLHRIQPAGKRPMTVAEFLNGQPGFYNRNNHLV